MREIKFRGKRKDTGEWVFGNYIKRNLDGIPQYYIYDNQWDETEIDGYCDDDDAKIYLKDCFIEVIPETVGQFTGKQDRNSSDVFDGDIVKPQTTKLYTPTKEEIGAVYWDEKEAGFMIHWLDDDSRLGISEFFRGVEIIGNIHDNPELLEEV
jgi:uncharacterized phage protein (TIGR01671 family)